jgi:hypothetical protein
VIFFATRSSSSVFIGIHLVYQFHCAGDSADSSHWVETEKDQNYIDELHFEVYGVPYDGDPYGDVPRSPADIAEEPIDEESVEESDEESGEGTNEESRSPENTDEESPEN